MPPWLAIALLPPLLGQVWIELPGGTPDRRAAVLRGCEAVLGEGECVAVLAASAENAPGAPEATAAEEHGAARAVVVWSDDGTRASLSFPSAPGSPARELRFDADDAEEARGEAVGLVVAAHVLGQRDAPRPPEPPPPPPAAATAPPSPVSAPRTPRWALDLGLDAGTGLDRGRARFGVSLRGSVRLGQLPLYLLSSAEAAKRFDAPRVHWIGGSGGLLTWLHTPWSRLDLLVHASGVLERVQVAATRGGVRARGSALRVGPRLGFELLTCPHARACLFGGFRVQSLFPRVRLELQGNTVGKTLPVELGTSLGLRLSG